MDLKYLCNKVIETSKEASVFIKQLELNFNYSKVLKKAKNDLVSYVDIETEKLLVKNLKVIFPEAGFITEEKTNSETKEFNWIIDPLDGTTNFIHRIPTYCISIALAKGSKIILGVVHEINKDETFHTIENDISYCNTQPIQTSKNPEISESLIATGFPVNEFSALEGYKRALEYFIRNTHGVRRLGSAAADLCYVACGRFDGFFELNLKPWDVAAGALIVKNAGGIVTDFSGKDNWLFDKSIIATSTPINKEFYKIITSCFKE
ncbi:MAG: inositol monophosphatase family protein [Bacteroidota bacterium]|jgi:myo-inositol-1(or 4)-monophosphatase